MSHKPLDTLIAIKVINLCPGLRQSDRRVGAALLEHFNRKTGRCDPGLERIAELLGYCTRTVIRATERLERAGLFRKVRHGGYSNRNSYEPSWSKFAQKEVEWTGRFRGNSRSRRSEMSPASRQTSHLTRDCAVTQTYLSNLPKQTYAGNPKEGNRRPVSDRVPKLVQPERQTGNAARVQAERRWSDDLLHAFRDRPVTYGEIIDLIDGTLAAAATDAELYERGAGLRHILGQLKLPTGAVRR